MPRRDVFVPASLKRRMLTAGLAEEVQELHGNRCPCCNRVMVKHRASKTRWKVPSDHPTAAHDIATGHGGNPVVWVFACNRCNLEQGTRTFEQWARHLAYYGDERAPLVAALATFIDDWCARNGVKRKVERKDRRSEAWHSLG